VFPIPTFKLPDSYQIPTCRLVQRTDAAITRNAYNDPVFYVVTSDQEQAIDSGLQLSQMAGTTIHFICALHMKWNVRDHMYVVEITL